MIKEKSKINMSPNLRYPVANLKVIAAIPCYNTAKTIGDVVTKTLQYVDEVLVIDDGSKDKTVEVARAAGARVICHGKNQGYGAAIKTCFSSFQKIDADILIIIDGDGQHNPDEIPMLINPLLDKKAELVIGSRFLNTKLTMPRYRRFGISVITLLWNFGSKIKVTDSQSGFRAYNKRLVQDIELTENGMGISIEIIEKIRKKRPVFQEIPISCRYEDNNVRLNRYAVGHGLRVALAVVKLRFKYGRYFRTK